MRYEKEFKEEAVRLADEIGVGSAAEKLGISYHTLADWRRTKRGKGEDAFIGSGHKRPRIDKTDHEQQLERENMELKRAKGAYCFVYYNRQRVNSINPGGWPPNVIRQAYYEGRQPVFS